MCIDWFSIDISDESDRKDDKTDPRPSSPVGNYLAQNKLLWKPGASLHCCSGSRYHHLEFLIHLLIGPIFKTPSWIWKTIESIVLETIAYCLSRLLIGYRPFERAIVVSSAKAIYYSICYCAAFYNRYRWLQIHRAECHCLSRHVLAVLRAA